MVNDFLTRGKRIVFSQQTSILSAATTIMMMLILSSLLGLVRNRVWATYFTPNDLSLVFAAFRLPDFVFGTLAFGAFSSAFIPVFSRALRRDQQEAWRTASYVVSLGLTGFFIVALLFALLAQPFYRLILPGYSVSDTLLISSMARILFLSQGLFIVSYVLTGVLESLQRFFVPALAPHCLYVSRAP
jgi:putative peptidoglycan lipid II flippase